LKQLLLFCGCSESQIKRYAAGLTTPAVFFSTLLSLLTLTVLLTLI
jgi:hypothetical protein